MESVARKKTAAEKSMIFRVSIFPPSTPGGDNCRVYSPDAGSISIERKGCQPCDFSPRDLKKKAVDNDV
jgi:hypothetical protein